MATPRFTTSSRPEPALIVQTIATLLSLVAAFGPDWLSPEQTAIAVTVVNAVAALIVGLRVRPIAPSLFTNVIGAVAALTAAYGFDVSQEVVGGVNAFVLALLALAVRNQSTPVQNNTVL